MKIAARTVAAVYALLLLIAPLAHHDVADHVKSSPHCQQCTARPLAARAEQRVAVAAPPLTAAGEVCGPRRRHFAAPPSSDNSGRSPPA